VDIQINIFLYLQVSFLHVSFSALMSYAFSQRRGGRGFNRVSEVKQIGGQVVTVDACLPRLLFNRCYQSMHVFQRSILS